MAIYRYHVLTGGDKFYEDEASAVDMASVLDMLRDMYGRDSISIMYVEEIPARFNVDDYLITGPSLLP